MPDLDAATLAILPQMPVLPRRSRPIIAIGAGGIVRDAHQPAYRQAGLETASVFDLDHDKARLLAVDFGIGRVCDSLEDAVRTAPSDAVFDMALPASAVEQCLSQLPDGAAVLIQKPLGENLTQARAIRSVCREKKLTAAVNFQLRYAPYVTAARALIDAGHLGQLHDLDVRVTVFMPWHLWTFLEKVDRVEIVYHSVHYVDLIRSFLGDPARVWARTIQHPLATKLASSRSNLVFDYGPMTRAAIATNHGHVFGPEHQESYIKWEGTQGAVKARLGLLMNYPKGEPDSLEYCGYVDGKTTGWQPIPLQGSWYPHAFVGPMSDLMRFVGGEIDRLPTGVEDAYRTMAAVEAAYQSDAEGGVAPPLEESLQ